MNNKIIERLERIETKLDNVIKALHDYDEGTLHCEYSGLPSVEAYSNEAYGESSFEAFIDNEEELNKRMDIIGQNGNEGSHYVTNEEADEDAFNDYGMRVVKDKNNTQDKRTGGNKKKYKGKRKFTQDIIPKNK
jgi:hypothetical protein